MFCRALVRLVNVWTAWIVGPEQDAKRKGGIRRSDRRIEGKNRELIVEIRRLKGDPQYLESVARKELGLVRENEVIYRFKKDSDVSGEGSDQKDKE